MPALPAPTTRCRPRAHHPAGQAAGCLSSAMANACDDRAAARANTEGAGCAAAKSRETCQQVPIKSWRNQELPALSRSVATFLIAGGADARIAQECASRRGRRRVAIGLRWSGCRRVCLRSPASSSRSAQRPAHSPERRQSEVQLPLDCGVAGLATPATASLLRELAVSTHQRHRRDRSHCREADIEGTTVPKGDDRDLKFRVGGHLPRAPHFQCLLQG